MDRSHALTSNPPAGAKALMAPATITQDQPEVPLPVITELSGHIRANRTELQEEEEEREEEAGRSQGAALADCPLTGRDGLGNVK